MANADLRFFGSKFTEEGKIPSDVLVKTINGFQQTAYILEAEMEGFEINQRFKPNESIKKAATLVCGIPKSGSYTLPISLNQIGTFTPNSKSLLDKVFNVLENLASKSVDDFKALLPDSRYREMVLQTVNSFLPKAGDTWQLEFKQNEKTSVVLNHSTKVRLKEWDVSMDDELEDTIMTVTGELIKIDFSTNSVSIRHPVSKREIECVYLPEIENTLIDSRRGLIQVTGQFILDDNGLPTKLTDVTNIEPVDMDEISLQELIIADSIYKIDPPLEITPTLDETKQYLVAEDKNLDLHVYGITREVLVEEIQEHIEMLWLEYANERDEILTCSAKKLKKAINSRISISKNGQSKKK